jgi:hypothetical protein
MDASAKSNNKKTQKIHKKHRTKNTQTRKQKLPRKNKKVCKWVHVHVDTRCLSVDVRVHTMEMRRRILTYYCQ